MKLLKYFRCTFFVGHTKEQQKSEKEMVESARPLFFMKLVSTIKFVSSVKSHQLGRFCINLQRNVFHKFVDVIVFSKLVRLGLGVAAHASSVCKTLGHQKESPRITA